jgi:hypothetical protein
MPSGFQQDNNQLSPGLYRVVWAASTGTYATGASDADGNGAITPNSSDSFATLPTTLNYGKARARGNMRFRNVISRLTGLADCQILDIETGIAGGGVEVAGNNQVTSLAFTVKYDRDEGVVDATTKLNSYGTTFSIVAVDGATDITTVALAIKDQFVRGFRDATTANVRVYNGTTGTDSQLSITVAAPDTAADIWADTTVTMIDGTELTTADSAAAAE